MYSLIPAMPEIGIITTTESGVDLVLEWSIDFFKLPETDGTSYDSPEFSFGGDRWWLWISPNGSSGSDSSGHVNLRLCKYDSDRSIRQSFSIWLKTAKGEKYNEQHVTKDFENWPEHRHEFHRFTQRLELTRRRSELVPEGVLTVVCTMKSTTSEESDKEETSNADVNKSDVPKASDFNQADTTTTKESEEETSNADVKKSDVPKASDFNQAVTTTAKESVLKWIKEICKEVLKGKKRKLKEENILKWIEENCKETSKGKKMKLEEKNYARSLCEDYKKVLFGGHDHNLILKVGDKEFRAHRDILRARSRVFESMLDHDMKEKNTGIINVPDCDPNAMELFLLYVYCGKIEAMDPNNMLGLYYVADKYEMMELKRECCNFIKKSLSLTNICRKLALKHSDSDLLEYATGYFSDNMLDIMKTIEWQSFLKDNATVGNELLMKSIKKLKNVQA